MSKARVFLVDSSIYIFRAWHIYDTSITDAEGRPTNAVFGFADFLYQLIRQKRPEHIACAFDLSQTDSYRKQLYPEYKANRDPAPEELRHQFELCRRFCSAIGIQGFGSNRYEADDIIGSLANFYRQQGYAITVISADKDLTQLVIGEEDRWWDFARNTLLDQRGVKKHFGVEPHMIADMLALSGDKVDNIPGIPGIGYTTAARILQKYSSVESVIENRMRIADMKFRGAARVQALLQSHAHILPLNKKLTTIYSDMEFPADLSLRWHGVNENALDELSEELSLTGSMQQRWHRLQTA